MQFLSTLSLRRATSVLLNTQQRHIQFLSTLSLRRATSRLFVWIAKRALISIHALLAESDDVSLIYTNRCQDFYPRSPCGERQHSTNPKNRKWNFYPRSPCGERLMTLPITPTYENISIHALLAESDGAGVGLYLVTEISIHALLAESDIRSAEAVSKYMIFLSTLSLRRATRRGVFLLS